MSVGAGVGVAGTVVVGVVGMGVVVVGVTVPPVSVGVVVASDPPLPLEEVSPDPPVLEVEPVLSGLPQALKPKFSAESAASLPAFSIVD